MKLAAFGFGAMVLSAASSAALAVPVEVEISGKVAVNTFLTFPFDGTPPGTDVKLKFMVESTSGFEPRPGFRLALTVTSASLHVSNSSIGPVDLPIGLNLPYTMPVFATVAIVPSLPNQDELDFGGGIPFDLGAIEFRHTFKAADGDDVSWGTSDIAQLAVCGVPGENFAGPNPDDFKHWYLLGDLLNPGVMNFKLTGIRRIALSGGDGDMNRDGIADGRDLQVFVDAILASSIDPVDLCHGDFSLNGIIDTDDMAGMVQTLVTGMPPPPPAAFGACCYLDQNFNQTCVDTISQQACTALAGIDHVFTFGRACADLDPACGGGACCLPDGSCQQFGVPGSLDPFADCVAAGGQFHGLGIPCVPNTCLGAAGACCLTDQDGFLTGECQFITASACTAILGQFFGEGVSCEPAPCAGACCVEGQDCVVVPFFQCAGEYKGDGTTCEFSPCPPANDACNNAILIGEGTTEFTLAGATTDGDEIPNSTPGCPQGFDPDNFIARDVWFTYIPSCTGTVQIDTCGSFFFGDSSDTSIAVYDGCGICPPDSTTTLLACSKSHSTGAPIQHCIAAVEDASVRVQVVSGQCYTIRAGTTNATTFGKSMLNIVCGGACCPPDGTLCTLTTQAECENVIGGFYAGNGTDCTFETCPGACCMQDGDALNCVITSVQQCLSSGGDYLGDGSFCEADSCGGACCIEGVNDCVVSTEEDCAAVHQGNFLGYGVACNWDLFGISICANGACCDGVTCTNAVRGTCDADFIVGEDCATYTCLDAMTGACCVGQTCTDTIFAVCRDQLDGLFFFGDACAQTVCP